MSHAHHFLLLVVSILCLAYLSDAACPGTLFIKRSTSARVVAVAFDGSSSTRVIGEILDTESCTSGMSSDGDLFCCLTLGSTNLQCWNLTLGVAFSRPTSPPSPLRLLTAAMHSNVTSLSISAQSGLVCAQPSAGDAKSVNCASLPRLNSSALEESFSSSTGSQVPYMYATIGSWNTMQFSDATWPVSAYTLRPSDGITTQTYGSLYAISKSQQTQLYTSNPSSQTSLQGSKTVNVNIQPSDGSVYRMAQTTQATLFMMTNGNVYLTPLPSSQDVAVVSVSSSQLGTLHSLASSRCSDIIGSFIPSNNTLLSFQAASLTSPSTGSSYSMESSATILNFPSSWISKSALLPNEQPIYPSDASAADWSSVRYAWGSNTKINSVLIFGSDYSCTGPNPNILHFTCINGTWVSDGDITMPTIIVGTTPILINGSLSLNGTITYTGSNYAPITITGCASLNASNIVITLTVAQVEALEAASPAERRRLLLSFNQTICDNDDLNLMPITVQILHAKKCTAKVSAKIDDEIQSKGTLSAVFNVASTKCSQWWIPLVAVIAAVVVIVVIIALVFTFSKSARECIRPFSKRNREQ